MLVVKTKDMAYLMSRRCTIRPVPPSSQKNYTATNFTSLYYWSNKTEASF